MNMSSFYAKPSPVESNITSFNIHNVSIDVISAFTASWFAAPIVGSIDRTTTQNLAGTNTIKKCIFEETSSMIYTPHRWLSSWHCLRTLPVYGLTYATANIFDTYFEKLNKNNDINNINASNEIIKTSAITLVNTSISIWKGRLFARKYGAILPSGLPFRSYFLFLVRDANQMAFAFTIPSVLTKYVIKNNIINEDNRIKFETFSQLTLPVFALGISTYFHLLALDIYNRRELKFRYRQSLIFKVYPSTLALCMIRIIPPFCIGPPLNTYFRQ
eukprot:773238_1